jgi:DNA-binding NarL/FixJ family response regulator
MPSDVLIACDDGVVSGSSVLRVLVVDDHVAVRSGLAGILNGEPGMTVIGQAANGESAVSMAARRRPDVIVMDVQLNDGMDGLEATRRVLEADSGVGVVMFTAYGEHHLLNDGLEAGARGFMIKDATPDEVVRGVRIVAEGGMYLDPSLSTELLRRRNLGEVGVLTPRERQVLELLAQGKSNREIAAQLFVSVETVRTHVRNAMRKLEADTRTQAVALAIRQRIIA